MSENRRVVQLRNLLKRWGVTLVDSNRFWLRCNVCGSLWSPDCPPHGRRLHNGYWKCERGCNDPRRLG
jgi:hypothetical protein